jgi:hypothetical protein
MAGRASRVGRDEKQTQAGANVQRRVEGKHYPTPFCEGRMHAILKEWVISLAGEQHMVATT